MRDFLIQHWRSLLRFGAAHGVDPWVFGALYLAHHPLFWGTMGWIAVRVRQKRSVAVLVAFAVFFWFLPYSYIFIFGRGLPWWVYVLVLLLLVLGGPHTIKEIRRRVNPPRQNE